jgi:hypothetical protein
MVRGEVDQRSKTSASGSKKIHFESGFDSESGDDVISGSAGIDESREDDGDGSMRRPKQERCKRSDKGKDKTVASKRPRRGRGGR